MSGETLPATKGEQTAKAMAFADRYANDMAADAEDLWLHTAEENRSRYRAMALAALSLPAPGEGEAFQARVQPWMMACFGPEISGDRVERGDRLLEEVLELLQSGGYDPARVAALRDYVWSRPAGEPAQEVGGVQVTLAAYCLAHALDMHEAGETELARIWTKVEKIRAKQATKPVGSALPLALCDGYYWLSRVPDGLMVIGEDGKGHVQRVSGTVHPNEDAAKAAAQAHYESRILSAIAPQAVKDGWQTVDTAPHACHVLATRFDQDCGEWVIGVVMSPPSQPFTHWRMLPEPPSGSETP